MSAPVLPAPAQPAPADEPATSLPFPAATAVEVVIQPARTSFANGIATGIAVAAVAVHVWLAFELAAFRGMYADFGGTIGAGTRLVLTAGWRWGVPAAGAAAVGALIFVRPKRLGPYAAVAVVMVATALATWYLARSPIYELAGNIRAD